MPAIDFILRANAAAFTKGLAAADNAVGSLKKSIKTFDVGGSFKQALGVGGVIAGFRMAITHAQELRDEADKMKRPIDAATRSVAEYGDAWANIEKTAKSAAVASLSFFTRIGEAAGSAVNRIRGISAEQEKIAAQAQKDADKAEENLRKSREENSPEKMKAAKRETAEAQMEADLRGTDSQKDLAKLINERAQLNQDLKALGPAQNTVEAEKIREKLIRNEIAMKKAASVLDKEAADLAEKKRKEQEKQNEAVQKVVDKFAPSVEELAKIEVGGFASGDDPRIKARQAVAEEEKARALYARGDLKGGMAAALKAEEMRKSLSGQTGVGGALTKEAAEDAFKTALDATNTKLGDIEKALSGIIKAQK